MAKQTIFSMNGCPIANFYLGHFEKEAGDHYVCLANNAGMMLVQHIEIEPNYMKMKRN